MFKNVFSFIIVLTICTQTVLTYNILAIISLPLRSHYMAFNSIFRELARRGHNVTVMNNFPDKETVPNLKFIDLEAKIVEGPHDLFNYEDLSPTYTRLESMYRHYVSQLTKEDCENIFTSQNAKKHLQANLKYDIIFVELFVSDCALALAGTFYDAPIIGITSHVLLPWTYPNLGIPFDVAADAIYFSVEGPNPSYVQKLESFFEKTLFNTLGVWRKHRDIHNIFNKYVPDHNLDIKWVAKHRVRMVFAYQHFSLTGSRVTAPQLLEIGGSHINTPKPVPREIEKFLSDAHNGAVFVSFGSNLKASTMSTKKLQQFLTAFKNLPYKVIWKWENGSLPAGYENIYTASWLPQLDILCHPKVRAFVSHGGMLSISEAAHCGKPVLTMPFFGDQFSNSAAVRNVGLGKTLFFSTVDAQNLEKAVRDLMSDEMQQSAQRVFRQWHDRPQSVMDSAIYWTEYVARHKTAPPSLPSKNSTWLESTLIDVYIGVAAILSAVVLIIYLFLKLLFCFIKRIFKYLFKSKAKAE